MRWSIVLKLMANRVERFIELRVTDFGLLA
jgi:hypothetical protein